jgi:hypothetical protein
LVMSAAACFVLYRRVTCDQARLCHARLLVVGAPGLTLRLVGGKNRRRRRVRCARIDAGKNSLCDVTCYSL